MQQHGSAQGHGSAQRHCSMHQREYAPSIVVSLLRRVAESNSRIPIDTRFTTYSKEALHWQLVGQSVEARSAQPHDTGQNGLIEPNSVLAMQTMDLIRGGTTARAEQP